MMRSRSHPESIECYLFVAKPFSACFVRAFNDAVFVFDTAVGASVRGKFFLE